MGLLSVLYVGLGQDSVKQSPPGRAALSTPEGAWPVPKAYVTSDAAQNSKREQLNDPAKGICPVACTLPPLQENSPKGPLPHPLFQLCARLSWETSGLQTQHVSS